MTNYHQHSTYCDGKDSLRHIVETAYQKEFSAVGLSSHAPLLIHPYKDPLLVYHWLMPREKLDAYIMEVRALQKEYEGKIKVFLGLEADYFNQEFNPGYWKQFALDYCVGSIHFLPSKKYRCPFLQFDSAGEGIQLLIDEYGGPEGFYRACFRQNMQMIKTGTIDILGHMDLFNKANQNNELFDCKTSTYFEAAEEVLVCAKEHNVVVEINTGYMARKGFEQPFPNYDLIEIGAKQDVRFCLNSDCHNVQYIDFGYREVRENIKKCGVKALYTMDEPGVWSAQEL
ncbi:MAG: histidinol-phosphatase [Spirochaetia bacterium]